MNVLAGYSESQLSRVIDVLHEVDGIHELKIVQNIALPPGFSFCPQEVHYEVLQAQDWNASADDQFLFGVARPSIKQVVFTYFKEQKQISKERYRNLIHSSSVISSTVNTGNGLFVEPLSVITSFTTLGFAVTVNRSVSIGHHCSIGDFVTINPGVHIAGHCTIGNGVQIGIGSVVFDHISIGEGSIIGGGSVVTKDIPAGVKAWGNPCKVMGEL